MEMMVSKFSSEMLSVGVVPAPELQPGNTSGAAKSATRADNNAKGEQSGWVCDTSVFHFHLGRLYGS